MELKHFLDTEKAKLDQSFNAEVSQVVDANRAEIERVGEEAKQAAINVFVTELQSKIKEKYSLAYGVIDNGYAVLPQEPVAV